jgi:hypothetical protein
MQLLNHLAVALRDLEQLADIVLVSGDYSTPPQQHPAADSATPATAAATASSPGKKDVELQPQIPPAAQAPPGVAGAQPDTTNKGRRAARGKAQQQQQQQPAAQANNAVLLAADANHKLQLVQQLLPMTKKERYAGTFGSYRCVSCVLVWVQERGETKRVGV